MENQKVALLKSWVQVPNHSDFTIYNLPFGIFKNKRLSPRVGIAIGDKIVDLSALQEAGFLLDMKLGEDIFLQDSLNPFIALGKSTTKKVRERVQQLLNEENPNLKDHQSRGKIMLGLKEAEMMMPVKVGDYTAFLSPSEQALHINRNLDHYSLLNSVPIGYHGKTSSILPSGIPIYRPKSQSKSEEGNKMVFGPSGKLDFEMELAFVVGKSSKLGESIPIADAEEYIFGLILINDWTSRDIQAGENGFSLPFSSKNFAYSMSPWIVTLDALEVFRTTSPLQDHESPFLQSKGTQGFDIQLEAYIKPEKGPENLVCQSNFKHAHWNMVQLLAQQTMNGCNVEIGDLLATGVASNPEENHFGSIMESIEKGPLTPEDGKIRGFVNDGDTVIIKGYGEKEGIRVGFGEVKAKLLPTK